jgi:hypothetical protein|tara:strand:- start:4741 stop:4968 length:228 start_codon:yes stop_codon:yes gene_type:complete
MEHINLQEIMDERIARDRAKIMAVPIWTSRLIFKSQLTYGKAYKDLSEQQKYTLHLTIITEQEQREEMSRRFNNY